MADFPLIRQHDSMQCGIACLQMICKYFKKVLSLDTLSRYCFATTEGVSLKSINDASITLGFHTIAGRVALPQLQQAPMPCILHWNQNHFVVLYRIRGKKRKRYYIADPGKGYIILSEEDFLQHWISTFRNGEEKGIALFLQPTPAFYENRRSTNQKSAPSPSSSAISASIAVTSGKSSWGY